jgi:hypothetical protein
MIEVLCIRGNKNTGKTECPFIPGVTKGGYLAPVSNSKITLANRADQDTLETFINAQLQHNNPALRWHMIGPFEDFSDISEAPKKQTLPSGKIIVTDRSHPAYEYQVLEGGKQYHEALISFNGKAEYYKFFPFDHRNVLQGTEDEDVSTTMTGYSLTALEAYDYKPSKPDAIAEFKGMIAMSDAEEMNEKYFAIPCSFNLSKVKGVQDVTLKDVTTGTTSGVHMIKALAGKGSINIVEVLGAAAALEGNYIMRNKTTKAAITKTGALSADGTYVILTASLADTDYVDGQDVEILFASVSVLAANGLEFYETPEVLVVEAIDP